MKKSSSKETLSEIFLDELFSDPHVRIVGRKEDVLRVKDKVMAVLDAKVSHQKSYFIQMFLTSLNSAREIAS